MSVREATTSSGKPKTQVVYWGLDKLKPKGKGIHCQDVLVPAVIKELNRKGVVAVRAGALFLTAMTYDGKLYSWGTGKTGRLGHGDVEDLLEPKLIEGNLADKVVVELAVGDWHSLALTDNGEVYAWGSNSMGELGLGHTDAVYEPTRVEALDGVGVSSLAAGYQYSAVLTSQGELFTFGNNVYGQLGINNKHRAVKVPTEVAVEGVRFTSVGCGNTFMGATTQDGNLYTWGRNDYGQLGLGKKSTKKVAYRPKLVQGPWVDESDPVIQYSGNQGGRHSHSLCLTASGAVYAWGDNYKWKCGVKQGTEFLSPVLVATLRDEGAEVLKVQCGGIHSSCLDSRGNLWTWGCGSNGRLGHPEVEGHKYLYKEKQPRMVDSIAGVVVDYDSSYYQMIAVVDTAAASSSSSTSE